MSYVTHNFQQGSPEWHQHRATHFNASEAAAMLGISQYATRSELLRQKATGIVPEVSAQQQRLFDQGHAVEAAARPRAELLMGTLYPMTASLQVDDLPLSASFDGVTIDDSATWECKMLNQALAASLSQGMIPDSYKPQLEQGLMIIGAEKACFTAATEDGEGELSVWYFSDPALRARIIAGWKQFAIDLAAYVPEAAPVEVIGHTPETLPALRIEVTGMVTASNLHQYKKHALAVFAGINRDLTTDQDFANAESVVKWCGDVESRLAAAKQHALSQTESIDALFKAIDDISAEARRTRLELDKLVTKRKADVRFEIQQEAAAEFTAHYNGLNKRLGKPYMPTVVTDFAGAMKGKRTVSSLRDAVSTELACAKIEASAIADKIDGNLRHMADVKAPEFLFSDLQSICQKAPDDFKMLVKSRIAEHQANEAAKEEAARARIRAEEQSKAEADARAKLADEQAKAALAERDRIAEEAAKVERIVTAPDVAPISHQTVAVEAPKPPQIIPKNIPKATRPTDDEIIGALALHYRVHESKVIEWLLAMDLQTASDRMLVEF